MKYLKTYKIFESTEDTRYATSDELSTIEDILLQIKDLDFSVNIHKNIGGEDEELEGESEVCRVYIEKFAVYGFSQEERECKYYPSEEFISTLQHLVSYVKEIDYDIEIESIDDSSVIDRVVVLPDDSGELSDEYVSIFSRYELNGTPISYIKITITYKD